MLPPTGNRVFAPVSWKVEILLGDSEDQTSSRGFLNMLDKFSTGVLFYGTTGFADLLSRLRFREVRREIRRL